jgi:hypothetical protein
MLEIILHTPVWVFAVFGLMLWWGMSSRRDSETGMLGIVLPPVISMVITAFLALREPGWPIEKWIIWLLAIIITTGVFALINRDRIAVAGVISGRVYRKGGNQVLIFGMLVFAVKYLLGYLSASQSDLVTTTQYQLLDVVSSGFVTGFICGRSIALLMVLRDQFSVPPDTAPDDG